MGYLRQGVLSNTGKIVGLDDGKLIQQSATDQRTVFDHGDLIVSAKDPAAFDAITHQALATGEAMNLSMQRGQISMMSQHALVQ